MFHNCSTYQSKCLIWNISSFQNIACDFLLYEKPRYKERWNWLSIYLPDNAQIKYGFPIYFYNFLNCWVVKREKGRWSILAVFVRRGATNLDCVPQRPLPRCSCTPTLFVIPLLSGFFCHIKHLNHQNFSRLYFLTIPFWNISAEKLWNDNSIRNLYLRPSRSARWRVCMTFATFFFLQSTIS